MNIRAFKFFLAAIYLAMAGCATQTKVAGRAATRPDSRPALDKKALLKLEELRPPVKKPSNPPLDELSGQVSKLFRAAQKRMDDQDYTDAVDILERAVGFAPSDPRLRKMLGMAYLGVANAAKARPNLIEAAEVAPDDLELQLVLGRLALMAGRQEMATIRLRTALKCSDVKPENPQAAEAMALLGQLLQKQGYFTASLQCFDRLAKWFDRHGSKYAQRKVLRDLLLEPEKLLAHRGRLLLMLRRADEAEELLRKAYHRDRTDTNISRNYLAALIESEMYKKAEEFIFDLISEPSQRGQLPRLVQMLCSAWGDKDLSLRLWRKCRQNDVEDDRLTATLARTARRNGAMNHAIKILSYSVKKQPTAESLWRQLFLTTVEAGRAKQLEGIAAEVLSQDSQALTAILESTEVFAGPDVPIDFQRRFYSASQKREYGDNVRLKAMMYTLIGKIAAERGDYHMAEDYYVEALEKSMDLAPTYEGLVQCYLDRRKCSQARQVVQKATEQFGKNSHTAAYLGGLVELSCDSARDATAILTGAVDKNPEHIKSLLTLAQAQERAGHTKQVTETLAQTIRANPDRVETYRQMFRLYSLNDAHEEAKKLASVLLSRQPGNIAGMCMLAEALMFTGDVDKGRQLLRRLAQEAPENADIELLKLKIELGAIAGVPRKEKYDEFKRRIEKLLTSSREVGATEALAILEGKAGLEAEAAEAWGKMYRMTMRRPDAAKAYAAALTRMNRLKQAAEVLKRRLNDNSNDNTAREFMLSVLEELKKPGRAEKYIRRWSQEADEQRVYYYRLRLLKIYENAKQYDKCIELLNKMIADGREDLKPEKIRYYGMAGWYDKAVEYAQSPLDTLKNDIQARRYLIAALAEGELYDRAVSFLDEWLADALDKEKPQADTNLELFTRLKIILLAEVKRIDKAREFARYMIEKRPNLIAPREAIVLALAQKNRHDDAIEMLEGWLASQLEKKVNSEITSWCRTMIVQVLELQGRYNKAVRRAKKYLSEESKNHELLSTYSNCLAQLGRDKQAMKALEKAYELKPDNVSLNNNLGYMYADRGVCLKKAEQMIRKALSERQDELSFLDSLGWVLYKQGEFSTAAETFLKVFRLMKEPSTNDAGENETSAASVLYDHAGDVFWRLGWNDRALRMWARAVELAGRQEVRIRDIEQVRTKTPIKIKAVKKGKEPPVAPLGETSAAKHGRQKMENRPTLR